MNIKDTEGTEDSVPKGEYRKFSDVKTKPSEEETQDMVHFTDRRLKIEADERTSKSSFTFVINAAKEEERRIFQIINRRMKKLQR